MKIALLRCCTTTTALRYFESSTNAVLSKLGVEFIDVKEFNCCGYPLKNYNLKAYLHASARNLALAEQRSLDLLTMCNCCYGSLKRAQHLFSEDTAMKDEIRESLNREGLDYVGRIEAKHFLQILHDTIGVEAIAKQVVRTFRGLKLAVHYGCHILRPKEIVQFDSPFAPTKFDRLVELTGAESIPWPTKLECCGSPVMGVNDQLSIDLTERKLSNAKTAGADAICVACPYCEYQFQKVQKRVTAARGPSCAPPSILFAQLLGLSLGIDEEQLGLQPGQMPATWLSAA
jgi:heterodisulfide reductase subunit B